MIIAWSREILRVGQRIALTRDFDGKRIPDQPAVVMRIASLDEYLADPTTRTHGLPPTEASFYEVSTD